MSEELKLSSLTERFLTAAKHDLIELENAVEAVREMGIPSTLSVQSAERQIEHFVGGFLSVVEGVKDLENISEGKASRLPMIKESLDFYLEQRFNEKVILTAVEQGVIAEIDNPIPAMRRMQETLQKYFALSSP